MEQEASSFRAADCTLSDLFGGQLPAWVEKRLEIRVDAWADEERIAATRAATAAGYLLPGSAAWLNDCDATASDDPGIFMAHLYEKNPMRHGDIMRIPDWVEGAPLAQSTAIGVFRASTAGPALNGVQMVHGGAIAALFDHMLGMTNMLNATRGATAQLEVVYTKPVPLQPSGTAVLLQARVDKVMKGKKIYLSGEMLDGETGELYGRASGLWIRTNLVGARPHVAPQNHPSYTPRIPLGRVAMQSGMAVTSAGRELLMNNPELVLDNHHAFQHDSDSRFQYYLDSPRLHRDLLWNRATGRFIVIVAFSLKCQGPPGRVHGGCQFACLDDAMTMFLYSRGVTDHGLRPGVGLTGGMTVNYRAAVPLDSEFQIEVSISKRELDSKGRTRVTLFAELVDLSTLSSQKRVLSDGQATFVMLDMPWGANQPGSESKASL